MYWSDDGDLMAMRVGNWKVHFLEQRGKGLAAWGEPFVRLRCRGSSMFGAIRSRTGKTRCSTKSGSLIGYSLWFRRR
jgi:hypothetical protein